MMTSRTFEAPTVDDDLIGVVLGSGYRVLARIGAGGMGVVYRVWDYGLERYAVVKMPQRAIVAHPGMLTRFEREMEAMRRMRHPAVVPVIDFGTHDGLPFAVMPYLAGGSLDRRRPIRHGQPAAARSATLRHWLPTVADALDHVHAAGLLHRDVKPHNILFDGQGRAVLADFGIATLVRAAASALTTTAIDGTAPGPGLTTAGQIIGTPEYVAPELVAGKPADGRADQYALAAVVHEILGGKPPISGTSPADTLAAQVDRLPPRLADLRPELPASLCEAVWRGLAKKPSDRFESCHEFAAFVMIHVPLEPEPPPRLACPLCDRMMSPPREWAGRNGRCPSCRGVLFITTDLQSVVASSERLAAPQRR
jgi:serine/threonine-protein kinase